VNGAALQDGMRLWRAGRLSEAAECYQTMLSAEPENFDALHAFAAIQYQQGHLEEAQTLMARAIALRPRSADLLYNRGSLLQKLGRGEEALACFNTALSIRPDYAEALGNRGALLMDMGLHDQALADFTRMTAANPSLVQGWSNHGSALIKLKRHREALASYAKALSLKPDFMEARRARALAYFTLGQFAEALSEITYVLARNPEDAKAWQQRGDILAESGRRKQAIESYGRAIALRPESADALFNRAHNLFALRRYEEAAADYAALVTLDPRYRYALGHLIFAKLCCCDWDGLDERIAELQSGLRAGSLAVQPFHALVLADSEAQILQATREFAEVEYPAVSPSLASGTAFKHDRIRIGYLSGNFHNHAVARLMAGVFEHHDRSRFETTAFSLGADDGGPLRRRLLAAFGTFLDVRLWDDKRIAEDIRGREIDILVDLMGFTENSRPGIVARRPAPVQVNYLGFAGTMGADYLDYLIADSVVIPEESEAHYSERIIRLPACYLPADRARKIADTPSSRTAADLPESGFVFCCFNHSYKIRPEILDLWLRLLQQTPGTVLWLNQMDPAAQRNLAARARERDVDPARIIFAGFVPHDADHLARLRLADLFLDTPGYNAHATALDALWAGLPVLSIAGDRFPARVGASLLNAVGLPELIARDLQTYEQMALALASDPGRLRAIRRKLSQNIGTQPLFDTGAFTRYLELAFETVMDRQRRGLPPAGFNVGASA
jgi:protein O-GlcNAc transferase